MTKPEPRLALMLGYERQATNDPLVCPTLVDDCYREPGQTFAQAWRDHIESTLNPEVSGDTAEDPRLFVVY